MIYLAVDLAHGATSTKSKMSTDDELKTLRDRVAELEREIDAYAAKVRHADVQSGQHKRERDAARQQVERLRDAVERGIYEIELDYKGNALRILRAALAASGTTGPTCAGCGRPILRGQSYEGPALDVVSTVQRRHIECGGGERDADA